MKLEATPKENRIESLKQDREILIRYLLRKVDSRQDWHAVADAAMDLREVEAEIKGLESFNE